MGKTPGIRCRAVGQRLVMGQHQSGTVHPRNDIRHCEGLARPRLPLKVSVPFSPSQAPSPAARSPAAGRRSAHKGIPAQIAPAFHHLLHNSANQNISSKSVSYYITFLVRLQSPRDYGKNFLAHCGILRHIKTERRPVCKTAASLWTSGELHKEAPRQDRLSVQTKSPI